MIVRNTNDVVRFKTDTSREQLVRADASFQRTQTRVSWRGRIGTGRGKTARGA